MNIDKQYLVKKHKVLPRFISSQNKTKTKPDPGIVEDVITFRRVEISSECLNLDATTRAIK